VLWQKLVGTSGISKPRPGDYDHDGMVEMTDDYNLWRRNFGSTLPATDGNGDGHVDAADYVVWRKTVGTSGDTGSGSGAGESGDGLGSNEGLSAAAVGAMMVEDPTRIEFEPASLNVMEEALSRFEPSQRLTKAVAQRYDRQNGAVGGMSRQRDLAAALASVLHAADDEIGELAPQWIAASQTDEAFECLEVLALDSDLLKADVKF
jgi:hypothetical protein